MKKKHQSPIVIIHFQPLELYPPIMNLLHYLGENVTRTVIVICTAKSKDNDLNAYQSAKKNIQIKRLPGIVATNRSRIFSYALFYVSSLWLLLKYRPCSVLYFETISSWPAMMYKKFRGKSTNLLAHYHEYSSKHEYVNNMRLITWMHKIESRMYPTKYDWISQTNEVRLQKFITDNQIAEDNKSILHTMPNYPSKYWAKEKTKFNTTNKIRLVYVGALGYCTMYLKELISWVRVNQNFLSLDLYAYNMDDKAKAFLNTINDRCITLHGGCNYEDLPRVLRKYDVGLVIYKPVSENWIHNAPNKVFEYVACGLDVWFSKTMTYTLTIARENVYPKIIPIDFENLKDFDVQKAIKRGGLRIGTNDFFYENVYSEIYKSLSKV